MGDWYDFDIRIINGKEVSGFCYCNESTGWQEVFIPMTKEQIAYANQYVKECQILNEKKDKTIKNWLQEKS